MKTKTQIIHDECKEYGGFIKVITKCGGTLVGHLWEKTMQGYSDQQTKEKDELFKSFIRTNHLTSKWDDFLKINKL